MFTSEVDIGTKDCHREDIKENQNIGNQLCRSIPGQKQLNLKSNFQKHSYTFPMWIGIKGTRYIN